VFNAERLLELFQQINIEFKQAFIITTHNPDVAKIANRSFYLENETLIERDTI